MHDAATPFLERGAHLRVPGSHEYGVVHAHAICGIGFGWGHQDQVTRVHAALGSKIGLDAAVHHPYAIAKIGDAAL
jgi:hypothetical protein